MFANPSVVFVVPRTVPTLPHLALFPEVSVDLGATYKLKLPLAPRQYPLVAEPEPIGTLGQVADAPPPRMYVYEIFVNYSFYFSFYNIYLYLPDNPVYASIIPLKDNENNRTKART